MFVVCSNKGKCNVHVFNESSILLQYVIQSSSVRLKLEGKGSGEWSKQKGGGGYEAGTCFMALDVREKYQSQIHRPLEGLELAQSL
jgi:hypothetical protein